MALVASFTAFAEYLIYSRLPGESTTYNIRVTTTFQFTVELCTKAVTVVSALNLDPDWQILCFCLAIKYVCNVSIMSNEQ